MIPANRLQGAVDRIHRAEEHLASLRREIAGFGQREHDSCTIGVSSYLPNTFSCVRKVPHERIPAIISILLGETVYNLRAALDYLVFELARADSGSVQEHTQFLICDTQKQFAKERLRCLKTLSAAHVAAIEGLQPYNGVKWTGRLRQISNPDKHRQLTPTNSGSGAQVLPTTIPYPQHIPWPIGHHEFRSNRRAKRADGIEVDVQLITSMEIGIPIEETDRRTGKPIVLALPLEEIIHEIKAGVRSAVESFKIAP